MDRINKILFIFEINYCFSHLISIKSKKVLSNNFDSSEFISLRHITEEYFMSNKIIIRSLKDIDRAAREFLSLKQERQVIALYGAMGAGKTTFTKAICSALGVPDSVNSPTFTIINEYRSADGKPIYHFDFYRINKLEEAFDIGFEEFIDSGELCLIEWPEKIEQILPDNCLKVHISVLDDESREITF